MSAPAPLTDPALLRTLIRSLPATPSPGPTIPASDQGGKSPHRRKRVPQPHTSASITTPWNDTLIPMSSQLPPPQPGRSTTMPDEDDLELAPEPRGLLRTIRSWYHRHPMIVDISIAAGVIVYTLVTGIAFLLRPSSPVKTYPILPLALIAIALLGIALALRRRCPVWSWAAILLIPEVYQFAVLRFFHFTTEQQLYATLGVSGMGLMSLPFALGTIASHRRPAAAWTAGAISLAVLTADLSLTTPSMTVGELLRTTVILVLFILVGILVGFNARSARLRLKAMELRSTRMALASEQAALLAAAEERSRIAREMHDVVAHSLAVMITMADGATAAIDRNPAMAKDALAMLAETGRSALADTRRLVGVLRDGPETSSAPAALSAASAQSAQSPQPAQSDSPPQSVLALKDAEQHIGQSIDGDADDAIADADAPRHRGSAPTSTGSAPVVRDLPVPEFAPPGTVAPVEPSEKIADLRREATDAGTDTSQGDTPMAPAPEQADLATLVSRFKAAGVPVTYTWKGSRLPEDKGLQLAMFRITQEALTNVLRYAPTTRAVRVTVDRHVGTAVLTVDNDAAPGSRPMHGSGKGLIGMRERAAVYGGSVQAGPTATGWRVRAVLRWDEDDEGTSPWQLPL